MLLLFAVRLERSLWNFQPKHPSTAGSVALPFLACFFHRHSLFGEQARVRGGKLSPAWILIAILTLHQPYLPWPSMFGNVLPASVKCNCTPRVALGIKATFARMWRRPAGPALVGLDVIVRRLHLLGLAGIEVGLKVLARRIGFVITILAVSVLCTMYQRIKPIPG